MITLLHTSPAHIAPFDALRDRIAPHAALTHIVREDWLARAQSGLDQPLLDEIVEGIAKTEGTVLCSCTTLGEVAATAGAIRIDAPMMAEAARTGRRILMVYALKSTRAPSTALLQDALTAAHSDATIIALDLSEFWPLFEAGETTAFAACIAAGVRDRARVETPDVVVLAQASMAAAVPLLQDMDMPVLSSPELALRVALATKPDPKPAP